MQPRRPPPTRPWGVTARNSNVEIPGAKIKIFRKAGAYGGHAPGAHQGERLALTEAFRNPAELEGWLGWRVKVRSRLICRFVISGVPRRLEAVRSLCARRLGATGAV